MTVCALGMFSLVYAEDPWMDIPLDRTVQDRTNEVRTKYEVCVRFVFPLEAFPELFDTVFF